MFQTPKEIVDFALAGDATITLESKRTDKWYTFKLSQATDRATGEPREMWFVALLSGPDNNADYTYIGMVNAQRAFTLTKGSKLAPSSTPVRAFAWAWKHVARGVMPPDCEVRHEGRCGRCGRKLTTPESVDRGIGPECWANMGGL